MTGTRCACGFTEAESGDETITDHLLEVFAPPGGRGNDGLLHEEAFPALTCLCGYTVPASQDMDDHFMEMFTPPNLAGPDGVIHKAVTR